MLGRYAIALWLFGGSTAHAAENSDSAALVEPDPTYVTITARVENPELLRPSKLSIVQAYAVAVCLGTGEGDGPGCVPIYLQNKRGAQAETKVAVKRLVELAPVDRLGRSLSVQSIRVRRNEIVAALARAVGLAQHAAASTGTMPPVDLQRAQKKIAELAVGRRKQVFERPLPAPALGPTTLAFELDPKNKESPKALTGAPRCEGRTRDPICDRPHVVLELAWEAYSAEASRWLEPVATSCRLPKGQTTTSLERDLDGRSAQLSSAQLNAERRMLRLATAVLETRSFAEHGRNADKAATRLWRFLDEARAGTPGALWQRHYAKKVQQLEHCVAHLEIHPLLHDLDAILRRSSPGGAELDEESELREIARLMRELENAEAQHNEVYGEANRRRVHLEIEPMQRLQHLMKNGAQKEVESFLKSTPCGGCQSVGGEWLRGEHDRARAVSNEALRRSLLDTETALRDMERGMQARQRDLAEACQSYEAGRTGRLLDDLREDQKVAREIVVRNEFDDKAHDEMVALRQRVLARLPEVANWLALPAANRCRKR